jgi:hypothetical protein
LGSLPWHAMALTHQDTHRTRPGNPSLPGRSRHQGQCELAEIVPLRPEPTSQGDESDESDESDGMVSRVARVFASLRAQAAPGGTPPRPPSSPAPLRRSLKYLAAPDDAA